MKKTLAAVLAAAMALSTATVAFARDTMEGETILENLSTVGTRQTIAKGKEYSYVISADFVGEDGNEITATELGKWVKDGKANVTVTVTEGMSKLASKPTATVKNIVTTEEVEITYKWAAFNGGTEMKVGDKVVAKVGSTINGIPTFNGHFTATVGDADEVVYPKDDNYEDLLAEVIAADGGRYVTANKTSTSNKTTAPVVQIKFKVADDWGTGSDDVGFKFRITFKKDVTAADGHTYSKGDTVMAGEALFSAKYEIMNDKGTEMELTREECKTNEFRQVLMNKDGELYDKIGNDEFTLYFENSAAFTGKMAANQKTLNMYYTLDEDSDLVNAYPDVDFEFIEFKGKPSFVNTGKMTFSAVGGSTTQVYEWDGEAWEPLNGTYNKTYNTVEVKGIKRLGKYAIASDILPVEEEPEEPDEPAEPVSSAPTTEPDDEGQNPNTGAC